MTRKPKANNLQHREAAMPGGLLPVAGKDERPHDRILDFKSVRQVIPVSKPTLMRWERAGVFPRRVRMSSRSVGWLESEVLAFVASRPRGLALQGGLLHPTV